MKKPPLIGITPDIDMTTALRRPQGGSSTEAYSKSEQSRTTPRSGRKGEPLIVLQERYARAIQDAGGLPLILPVASSPAMIRKLLQPLDGILVSGGNFDIHPRFYGEEPLEVLGRVKEERTQFELGLISLALKRDLPLLGVCGGAQAINVALGGSLYQDIDTQLADGRAHQRGRLKGQGGHRITVLEGTKLRRIVERETLEVNTTHHQAVKRLGKGLIVDATAEDGIIEGIESEEHAFVLGVQWHPEFLAQKDRSQKKIFAAFVLACKSH